MIRSYALTALVAPFALSACGDQGQQSGNTVQSIRVRSAEQEQLHTLDALNLAIALKRAIYDAGYVCRRVTNAGFVANYKNLDMWTAECSEGRQWAIFAGPDGSAQVRDCKDVPAAGLPACTIAKRPEGTFDLEGNAAES